MRKQDQTLFFIISSEIRRVKQVTNYETLKTEQVN